MNFLETRRVSPKPDDISFFGNLFGLERLVLGVWQEKHAALPCEMLRQGECQRALGEAVIHHQACGMLGLLKESIPHRACWMGHGCRGG